MAGNRMDWVAAYEYPRRLARLQPGEAGVFVCPPAWNGPIGKRCGAWVKAHTDWVAQHPKGTPFNHVFCTVAHRHGLMVVRPPLPGQPHFDFRAPPRYTFRPIPVP